MTRKPQDRNRPQPVYELVQTFFKVICLIPLQKKIGDMLKMEFTKGFTAPGGVTIADHYHDANCFQYLGKKSEQLQYILNCFYYGLVPEDFGKRVICQVHVMKKIVPAYVNEEGQPVPEMTYIHLNIFKDPGAIEKNTPKLLLQIGKAERGTSKMPESSQNVPFTPIHYIWFVPVTQGYCERYNFKYVAPKPGTQDFALRSPTGC